METITLPRTGEKPLRFKGKLIAKTETSSNDASPAYSGMTGIWSIYRIYETQQGRYVCQLVTHSQWQGDSSTYGVKICATPEEVSDFFGFGWIGKDLYRQAGFEFVEEVDI